MNGKAAGAQAVTGVPKAPRLENLSGDFNCFLNAVVQALWQCAAFRKGVLSLNSRAVQVRLLPYRLCYPIFPPASYRRVSLLPETQKVPEKGASLQAFGSGKLNDARISGSAIEY